MTGWNISITRQNSCFSRMMPASKETKRGIFLAAWYADSSGLEWLDKLKESDKLLCLQEGFYPGLYTGKAKDVLPSIQEMPPCVREKYTWIKDEKTGEETLCRDGYHFGKSEGEISSCKPNEWLRIEIWDLS
jgi:hypothetical protein